jgi:hypothetical protein
MIKDKWSDKSTCICSDDRFLELSRLMVKGFKKGDKYQYTEKISSIDNHYQVNVYHGVDCKVPHHLRTIWIDACYLLLRKNLINTLNLCQI